MTFGPRASRSLVTLAAVAALAAAAAANLIGIIRADDALPPWDPAAHGLAGLDLARALARLDLLSFLDTLNRQTTWPFAHPLMLVPFFIGLGDGFTTGEVASAVLGGATVVALFLAGLSLDRRRGDILGVLAAALALTSPAYAFFGTVTMLEIPGALLMVLAIAAYARSCQSDLPSASRWRRAAGWAAVALFFCKYNYGLLWIVPLALFEADVHRTEGRAWLRTRALAILRSGSWLRPLPLLAIAYLAFVVVLAATGGGVFRVAGVRVSVRSPGNAAYALYLVFALALAWRALGRPAWARERWNAVPRALRQLWGPILVPISIWFLVPVPNHLREFVGFVFNRSEGPRPWTPEWLLYYPRVFVTDYSPSVWVGVAVLCAAFLPLPRSGPDSARDPRTLVRWALVLGLAGTMLHPYQQPRFLFTTAALIWISAAMVTVAWIERLTAPRESPAAAAREALWLAALAAVLIGAWLGRPAPDRIREARASFLVPGGFAAVLDRVLDEVELHPRRGVLLGYGNQLSPGLLAWHSTRTRPELARARLPRRVPWLEAGSPDEAIRTRVEALAGRAEPVFSALPVEPDAVVIAGVRRELWADSVTMTRLKRDPRFHRVSDALISGSGYRVGTFVVRSSEARP